MDPATLCGPHAPSFAVQSGGKFLPAGSGLGRRGGVGGEGEGGRRKGRLGGGGGKWAECMMKTER